MKKKAMFSSKEANANISKQENSEKEIWSCDGLSSKAEWFNRVDDEMNKCLLGKNSEKKYFFWDFESIFTEPGMKILGENPTKWLPINKIKDHLYEQSYFDFWSIVFKYRRYFPKKDILKVWQDCVKFETVDFQVEIAVDRDHYLKFGYLPYGRILEEYHGRKRILGRSETLHWLKNCVFADPNLIDSPVAGHLYSMAKLPGYKMLKQPFSTPAYHVDPKLTPSLIHALDTDNGAAFAIFWDMSDCKFDKRIKAEIINRGAADVLFTILDNKNIVSRGFSAPEACAYLVGQMPDKISLPFLTALENRTPGIIKSIHDDLGRNLLWYAMLNQRTAWFHPDCQLTRFLLDCGCDPNNENTIGITWNEASKCMTHNRKIREMHRRYYLEEVNGYRGASQQCPNLVMTQPLDKIA